MQFNSIHFLLFFIIVFAVYWALPRRFQNCWLVLSSLFFYGYWDWRFLILLLISTGVDFVSGLGIARGHARNSKFTARGFLWLSLVVNLGFLFAFKYFGLFQSLLNSHDSSVRFSATAFIIPVGISFYTFTALGYVFDVYRKSIQPTKSYMDFILFVSFFPHLVAGPIERAAHLLPQIEGNRTLNRDRTLDAVCIFIWGLFLKSVVADNLQPFVVGYFEHPEKAGTIRELLSVYAGMFHVYGDFAGYSYMAIGVAGLLGFSLPENFKQPFFSKSPQEFWSRWHITLVNWFRSYLFFPSAGIFVKLMSTRGAAVAALFLTMVTFSVWHGPAVTFLIWGVTQAFVFLLYHGLHTWAKRTGKRAWPRWIQAVIWINVLGMTSEVYRWRAVGDFAIHRDNLFRGFQNEGLELALTLLCFAGPVMIIEAFHVCAKEETFFKRHPWMVRACLASLLYLIVLVCGVPASWSFIYFYF